MRANLKERAKEIHIVNLRGNNGVPVNGALLIDRRSNFGNPYKMKSESDRDAVIDKFENWLIGMGIVTLWSYLKPIRTAIREGRDLACWCYPKRCHGEVLLKLAVLSKQELKNYIAKAKSKKQ